MLQKVQQIWKNITTQDTKVVSGTAILMLCPAAECCHWCFHGMIPEPLPLYSKSFMVIAMVFVCPSITSVDSVETNKHIFKIFSPPGSHTILVFSYQTLWQYSDEDPRNGDVECRWGKQKSGFSTNIWLSDRWLLECEQQLWWSIMQFTTQTAMHQ